MNKKKILTAAISLALTTGTMLPVQAQSTEIFSSSGKDMFELTFFDSGEGNANLGLIASDYTLTSGLKQAVNGGVSYWSDILAAGSKNSVPVQIFVRGMAQAGGRVNQNAFAAQVTGLDNKSTAVPYWNQAIQQGLSLLHIDPTNSTQDISKGFIGIAGIEIGQYLGDDRADADYGWTSDPYTVLPTNDQTADLTATLRHEIGHALGILRSIDASADSPQDDYGNKLASFFTNPEEINPWSQHLVDQNGNHARAGMPMVTSDYFAKLQAKDASIKASDYFIIDNLETSAPHASIASAGQAYFVGSHVSEVLDGKTFSGMDGLPVIAWENNKPSLGHLTTSTLMSHAFYRNYTTFTEAELAILQDIGYAFDRRKYFGYSVYKDGASMVNTHGYGERNAAGTDYVANSYSTVPLGIGLHVYGSKNQITQAADLLTAGDGAVGMRIDGTENTITVPSGVKVRADGLRGIGVLISYGRNQTLDQQGTITANGTGGNAVQFDFGSDVLGAGIGQEEYRGSYIRYWEGFSSVAGHLTVAENLTFAAQSLNYPAVPELEGPLVTNYNLRGALSGASHAIYIGKNAFVQNINVLPGASIAGDITSDWKKFTAYGGYDGVVGDKSDALKIRYNNKLYDYSAYIPDLVTQLNFAADIAYSGNITGDDNLKLNVTGGRLNYSGTANVVNVNVASGAALAGGTYTVNDMTGKMAAGFSDTTTGQFINHGTIMPGAENMTINGSLVSDGSIGLVSADAQTAKQIVVSGTADITGSKLAAVEGSSCLPGKSYTFLRAENITGSLANTAGSAFSGLLSLKNLENSGTAIGASFAAENHLGTLSGQEQAALELLPELLANTASDRAKQAQLGQLYGAPAAAAKQALQNIAGNTLSPDTAALVVSNMTAMNAIGARIGYLSTNGALTGTSKARAEEDTTREARIIPIDMGATSSGWLKFSKSWESLGRDATSGHGSAISIGFDHKVNADWRVGEFFTYGKNSFSAGAGNLDNTDYRLGVYGVREHGPQQTFVYFDIGRQTNDSKRYISAVGNYLANSSYKSRTIELGARYSYDLDYAKEGGWHKKPYAEAQIVHYRQDGYTESDAGVWNQTVKSENTTYSAVTLGMSMEKKNADSDVELRAGYKRVLSGNDPSYRVHFTDAAEQGFTVHGSSLDKNLIVLGVHAGQEMGSDWRLEGDLQLEKGSTEKNLQASVMVKKSW